MGKKHFSILALLIFKFSFLLFNYSCAQPVSHKKEFTRQDTLRGSITPERAWWDVMAYDIDVRPDYNNKTIAGISRITFRVLKPARKMQIDLQRPLEIDSVILSAHRYNGKFMLYPGKSQLIQPITKYTREGNVYFIDLEKSYEAGSYLCLNIFYHGKPIEAVRPPWDGGWIWKKDEQGRPWMSVACQGTGASVWYPCKDHQSDEPDKGASITITVPDTLVAVANGRLQEKRQNSDQTTTYTWRVVNPINNYNIIPYIGKYVTWHEDYAGEKGKLDCDYWVMDYNLEKAKEQFKQVPGMMKALEYWFGPYPFYEDGYKLVESPHLGMEHQSAVAYGNKFRNGYSGKDLSGSGWGMKWDFIILHESAHEWFANNITTKDIADMWVHESFANYAETLYTEYQFGKEAGTDYVAGIRKLIQNDAPIIGKYGVNHEGSGDMYYKGGNLLHNIRQVIGNDEKFRQILRGLNRDFYHQTVTGKQVEAYFSQKSGIDLSGIFDQYLRTTQVPKLEYYFEKDKKDQTKQRLYFRWTDCIKSFKMPVKVNPGEGQQLLIKPVPEEWKYINISLKSADKFPDIANRNYYIRWSKV